MLSEIYYIKACGDKFSQSALKDLKQLLQLCAIVIINSGTNQDLTRVLLTEMRRKYIYLSKFDFYFTGSFACAHFTLSLSQALAYPTIPNLKP